MKIFEVTLRTNEAAAPGSFMAKAGVFGRAFGQALATKLTGVDQSKYDTQTVKADDYTKDAKQKAQELTQKMLPQVSQSMIKAWNQSVATLKSRTPDSITKIPPASTLDMVPDANRLKALYNQLSAFMTTAVGSQINAFDDLYKIAGNDPATKSGIDAAVRNIKTQAKFITDTEPSDKNKNALIAAWTGLSKNLLDAVNLAKFAPRKTGGPYRASPEDEKITVDGKPFDDKNAQQVKIIKDLADRLP